MKIVIVGSGAMGCFFATYLMKKNDVTLLCHYEDKAKVIAQNGLTVVEPDGRTFHGEGSLKVDVSGHYQGEADLLIVLTKTLYTEEALTQNAHLMLPETKVLTLQNGGGNAEELEKFCPRDRVFIGTTKHNCVNLGGGTIRHSGQGITYIGAVAEGISPLPIVEAFRSCGLETEAVDNILHLVWEKLFVNVSINSFTAILRVPIGACISNEASWDFMQKVICEAVDVARAAGQDFTDEEALAIVHGTCERLYTGYSSMSQDIMHGHVTEIDCINGYVVREAARLGIRAPYNELVQTLVHAAEKTYEFQKKADVQ